MFSFATQEERDHGGAKVTMIDWLKKRLTSFSSAPDQVAYEFGSVQEWPLDYGNDQRLAELLASRPAKLLGRSGRRAKL